MTWYNTTKEPNKSELDERAQSQEDKILDWFIEHPTMAVTPFYIHALVMPRSPVTSTRRALTNLTMADKLEKTDNKVIEIYGISNHQWRLKERQLRLF